MKRKTKKAINHEMNYSSPAPWTLFKTKQAAWQGGYNARIQAAVDEASQETQELRRKIRQLEDDKERVRLDALKNICQAGSSVIEGMSKAMLAYEKCL